MSISGNDAATATLQPRTTRTVWGWALYDVANSAFATTILAVIFNKYYALKVAGGDVGTPIHFFNFSFQIPGTTLFSYFVSLSTLIVMLISPFAGAMADATGKAKQYLLTTTLIGAVATGMLYWVGEGDWLFGGVWFTIANIGFCTGLLFYDALLKEIAPPEQIGRISGLGWGVGYLGGGLLLLINLIMLKPPAFLGITAFSVPSTFMTVAIWWLLFSIPLLWWVPTHAKPVTQPLLELWSSAWFRLKRTAHETSKLRDLTRFLIAYFFFNNGIQTVILMASIYGEAELKMDSTALILFFLMIQLCGFFGSALFGRFADKVGDRTILLITILIWSIICIWTFSLGVFTDPVTEFHLVGILAGLVLGASQSSARSLFARFTPASRAAEFFGFFSVQGRISTLLGPFVYGSVIWLTGSIRLAILFLLIFFVTGGLILWFVNEQRGTQTALSLDNH